VGGEPLLPTGREESAANSRGETGGGDKVKIPGADAKSLELER